MIRISPIPALEDNYFWLIQPDKHSRNAFIVDPGDATPVIDALSLEGLDLQAILVTHHHSDHISGIAEVKEKFNVPVYGRQSIRIPQITHPLLPGDSLQLDTLHHKTMTFQVLDVAGHTLDHIAYFFAGDALQPPSLFCGDALFAGGCGRRFEGTEEVMWQSLERMANLPDETLIYCAHEYTLSNLRFAVAMEPDNIELQLRLQEVEKLRHQEVCTLPSSIGIEKRTNPFLRCHLPQLRKVVESLSGETCATPARVFGTLRRLKDDWR